MGGKMLKLELMMELLVENFKWKEDMLENHFLTEKERDLLKNGPHSLSEAWRIQALKYRYIYESKPNKSN